MMIRWKARCRRGLMDEIMIDDDGGVRRQAVGLPVYEHESLSLEDEVQLDGLVYMPTPHDEAMMTHCLGYAQTRNSLFKHELQSRVMKIDISVLSHGFLQISKRACMESMHTL